MLLLTVVAAVAQIPQRIVSLNLCTDEMLLRLVPSERIASVTWLSRDSDASNVSAIAKTVAINHGSAEEVIPAAPDLVLVGEYTAVAATSLLRRTGFRVESFAIPRDFEGAKDQIRAFGKLTGVQAAADTLIAHIDAGLPAVAAAGTHRPRALVLNPNGVTVGPNTLADAVMIRAGLDNIAARLPLGGYEQVPLEKLASLDVEVLIVSGATQGAPSLATDVLRHPVLQKLSGRMIVVDLPGRLWGCAGPGLVEATTRLRAAAEAAVARRASQ